MKFLHLHPHWNIRLNRCELAYQSCEPTGASPVTLACLHRDEAMIPLLGFVYIFFGTHKAAISIGIRHTLYQAPVWDCSYGRLDLFYFQLHLGMTAHSCFLGSPHKCRCTAGINFPDPTHSQLVYSPKQICSGLLLLAMRSVIHRHHRCIQHCFVNILLANLQRIQSHFLSRKSSLHSVCKELLRSSFPRPTKGGILHTPCCDLFFLGSSINLA